MRYFRLLLLIVVQPVSASALSIDDVMLPDLDSSRIMLIEEMPDPRRLRFDPIVIAAFPAELESFRRLKIERYNIRLKARCDHLDSFDAYVRNELIPSSLETWDRYEREIKGQINSEKKKCDVKNETSDYATVYDLSIDQLKRFSDLFGAIQALCANSPSCTIGNASISSSD